MTTNACDLCGKSRTKAEGGEVFTRCDTCWGAGFAPDASSGTVPRAERVTVAAAVLQAIIRASSDYPEDLDPEDCARLAVKFSKALLSEVDHWGYDR